MADRNVIILAAYEFDRQKKFDGKVRFSLKCLTSTQLGCFFGDDKRVLRKFFMISCTDQDK